MEEDEPCYAIPKRRIKNNRMKKKVIKKPETRGRKQKYGEPTIKVSYRIPVSMKPELDSHVSDRLSKFEAVAKGSA